MGLNLNSSIIMEGVDSPVSLNQFPKYSGEEDDAILHMVQCLSSFNQDIRIARELLDNVGSLSKDSIDTNSVASELYEKFASVKHRICHKLDFVQSTLFGIIDQTLEGLSSYRADLMTDKYTDTERRSLLRSALPRAVAQHEDTRLIVCDIKPSSRLLKGSYPDISLLESVDWDCANRFCKCYVQSLNEDHHHHHHHDHHKEDPIALSRHLNFARGDLIDKAFKDNSGVRNNLLQNAVMNAERSFGRRERHSVVLDDAIYGLAMDNLVQQKRIVEYIQNRRNHYGQIFGNFRRNLRKVEQSIIQVLRSPELDMGIPLNQSYSNIGTNIAVMLNGLLDNLSAVVDINLVMFVYKIVRLRDILKSSMVIRRMSHFLIQKYTNARLCLDATRPPYTRFEDLIKESDRSLTEVDMASTLISEAFNEWRFNGIFYTILNEKKDDDDKDDDDDIWLVRMIKKFWRAVKKFFNTLFDDDDDDPKSSKEKAETIEAAKEFVSQYGDRVKKGDWLNTNITNDDAKKAFGQKCSVTYNLKNLAKNSYIDFDAANGRRDTNDPSKLKQDIAKAAGVNDADLKNITDIHSLSGWLKRNYMTERNGAEIKPISKFVDDAPEGYKTVQDWTEIVDFIMVGVNTKCKWDGSTYNIQSARDSLDKAAYIVTASDYASYKSKYNTSFAQKETSQTTAGSSTQQPSSPDQSKSQDDSKQKQETLQNSAIDEENPEFRMNLCEIFGLYQNPAFLNEDDTQQANQGNTGQTQQSADSAAKPATADNKATTATSTITDNTKPTVDKDNAHSDAFDKFFYDWFNSSETALMIKAKTIKNAWFRLTNLFIAVADFAINGANMSTDFTKSAEFNQALKDEFEPFGDNKFGKMLMQSTEDILNQSKKPGVAMDLTKVVKSIYDDFKKKIGRFPDNDKGRAYEFISNAIFQRINPTTTPQAQPVNDSYIVDYGPETLDLSEGMFGWLGSVLKKSGDKISQVGGKAESVGQKINGFFGQVFDKAKEAFVATGQISEKLIAKTTELAQEAKNKGKLAASTTVLGIMIYVSTLSDMNQATLDAALSNEAQSQTQISQHATDRANNINPNNPIDSDSLLGMITDYVNKNPDTEELKKDPKVTAQKLVGYMDKDHIKLPDLYALDSNKLNVLKTAIQQDPSRHLDRNEKDLVQLAFNAGIKDVQNQIKNNDNSNNTNTSSTTFNKIDINKAVEATKDKTNFSDVIDAFYDNAMPQDDKDKIGQNVMAFKAQFADAFGDLLYNLSNGYDNNDILNAFGVTRQNIINLIDANRENKLNDGDRKILFDIYNKICDENLSNNSKFKNLCSTFFQKLEILFAKK